MKRDLGLGFLEAKANGAGFFWLVLVFFVGLLVCFFFSALDARLKGQGRFSV